jgi:hypothetical protein
LAIETGIYGMFEKFQKLGSVERYDKEDGEKIIQFGRWEDIQMFPIRTPILWVLTWTDFVHVKKKAVFLGPKIQNSYTWTNSVHVLGSEDMSADYWSKTQQKQP